MNRPNEDVVLQDAYSLMAGLWCSPQDMDFAEMKKEAWAVVKQLDSLDEGCARALSSFVDTATISEEEYVDLFELEPKCSLYLGSHVYEEPKTCAGAGVSDRNDYMIDLMGVYKHFKFAPNGNELPDYLPLMVDFLSLTVSSKEDVVRSKLINEYILPFLPPMRKRLEELKTPYVHLLDALEKIVNYEIKSRPYSGKGESSGA